MELEAPKETKLLGTIVTNDLKWDRNTNELVKKASKRMQILFKAAKFTTSKTDLKDIYITFIRSILETSSVVWHSSLTKSNRKALERMQKMAVRVIMGKQFQSYRKSLKALNIDTLEVRREKLCLSFAKKCVQHEKLKHWFPLNNLKGRNMKTRKSEKFKVLKGSTDRYKKSAIPYMRRLLNDDYLKKLSIHS